MSTDYGSELSSEAEYHLLLRVEAYISLRLTVLSVYVFQTSAPDDERVHSQNPCYASKSKPDFNRYVEEALLVDVERTTQSS